MDEKLLLDFAISVGELMLKNGAETQRVEDTMERILSTSKYNLMPETFVTPTGIFAGIAGPLSGTVTKVKRVSERSINLEKVTKGNDLSRKFVEGKIGLRAAFEELNDISSMPGYNVPLKLASYTFITFCFTLLFSGSLKDAYLTSVAGFILGVVMLIPQKSKIRPMGFVASLFGSLIATAVVMVFYYFSISDNYEIMIMGTIMPLVPGFAITSSVRDIMYGDYISGGSMMTDALLTAVAVAAGVGICLTGYNILLGGAAL